MFEKTVKTDSKSSHEYFQGHCCNLPAEKICSYNIRCSPLRRMLFNIICVRNNDIRAYNIYRSYAALNAEKYRQFTEHPFSIHPFSALRFWLEATFVVILIVSQTSSAIHNSEQNPDFSDAHQRFMLFLDLTYIFNIILSFFTGYIEGDTQQYVVLELRKILWNYATSYLAIDLISCVNIIPKIYDLNMNLTVCLILESTKLLRVPMLFTYLNNCLVVLRATMIIKTAVELIVTLISYLTWNIFFQYTVEYIHEGKYAPQSPRECSWISIAKLWNDTSGVRFMYALDRAVGMLRENANLNLIRQEGCFENFFIISWIIAKFIVFHCALKYIIALFGTESARAKYFMMAQQVETYMNLRKFPPRIKKKILKFYAVRYQSHFFVESRMMSCVSGQLREDIIMHTGRQLVRDVTFLKTLPRALLLQIGIKLKVVIFVAGDIIFKINTIGDCLYFIDKGTVAIYSESGKEVCHLEDGDFFGEIALVMKHRLRTASAVTVTNCELYRLDRADFETSIACYPTVYEDIKKVAMTRFETTCVLDEHHKTQIKMMENDKRIMSDINV